MLFPLLFSKLLIILLYLNFSLYILISSNILIMQLYSLLVYYVHSQYISNQKPCFKAFLVHYQHICVEGKMYIILQ